MRASSNRSNLTGLAIECVLGDLADGASLERALAGCEALFHVAADYRLWTPDPKLLYRSNVEGTRNIIEAARRSAVRRIVYTSSVATIGLRADGAPSDEADAGRLDQMIGHYKRSKFLAEQWVCTAARAGMPIVIVNPSTPIGPGDVKPTPTGRLVLDAATGRMPAYVDTGLNIVHVDDVAAGHLLAYEHGRIGERYILGGTDLSLQRILSMIALKASAWAWRRRRCAFAARCAVAARLRGRSAGAHQRARDAHHGRCGAHGAPPDVFLQRPRGARTRLPLAAGAAGHR